MYYKAGTTNPGHLKFEKITLHQAAHKYLFFVKNQLPYQHVLYTTKVMHHFKGQQGCANSSDVIKAAIIWYF